MVLSVKILLVALEFRHRHSAFAMEFPTPLSRAGPMT